PHGDALAGRGAARSPPYRARGSTGPDRRPRAWLSRAARHRQLNRHRRSGAFIRRLPPLGQDGGTVCFCPKEVEMRPSTALRGIAITALLAGSAPALAGTTLTLPATGAGAVDGTGLTITNAQSYLGSGHPRPFAIKGVATGATAGGLLGQTDKRNGI